jgi:hypothetical protein
MARKRRKISKDEVDHLYRKCQYCKAHRNTRLFDRHEAACKAIWIVQNESRQLLLSKSVTAIENAGPTRHQDQLGNFMEGSSKMQVEDIVVEADPLNMARASEPNPSQ